MLCNERMYITSEKAYSCVSVCLFITEMSLNFLQGLISCYEQVEWIIQADPDSK